MKAILIASLLLSTTAFASNSGRGHVPKELLTLVCETRGEGTVLDSDPIYGPKPGAKSELSLGAEYESIKARDWHLEDLSGEGQLTFQTKLSVKEGPHAPLLPLIEGQASYLNGTVVASVVDPFTGLVQEGQSILRLPSREAAIRFGHEGEYIATKGSTTFAMKKLATVCRATISKF